MLINKESISRSRKKAAALAKRLSQLIRKKLKSLVIGNSLERSLEEFRRLSGQGDSHGWRFNRDEIHDRS